MNVLKLEKIKKSFGKKEVLKGIDIELFSGEIIGFIGRNGQGKSTTLKIIMGLIFPDSGKVTFFEDKYDNPYHKIGFVHESPSFWEEITAFEFLYSLGNIDGSHDDGEIETLLEFAGLIENKDVKIREFSRGMKQRLGIAQALLNDPELLILDEPMTALDPLGKSQVKELMIKLKNKGKSILFSSHQLNEIKNMTDKFILLNDGKISLSRNSSEITDLEEFFLKGVGYA